MNVFRYIAIKQQDPTVPDSNSHQGIKNDKKSFERVEEFKYLETTLMNQNTTHKEIKSRMKTKNACYHSVQNICLTVCHPKIYKLRYKGV